MVLQSTESEASVALLVCEVQVHLVLVVLSLRDIEDTPQVITEDI